VSTLQAVIRRAPAIVFNPAHETESNLGRCDSADTKHRACRSLFGWGIRGNHHNHGSGIEATGTFSLCGARTAVANSVKLPLHCDHLGQSSLSAPHCGRATAQLIWWNFAHLFMVSLIPFSTAWIATSRIAAVPGFVYAAIFVLVNIAYLAFECEALSPAENPFGYFSRGLDFRVDRRR
jgi:hypothetical protein